MPSQGGELLPPDTHLVLTFATPPTIGAKGTVRIFDVADGALVDTLDLSIPASPPSDALGSLAFPRVSFVVNGGPGNDVLFNQGGTDAISGGGPGTQIFTVAAGSIVRPGMGPIPC